MLTIEQVKIELSSNIPDLNKFPVSRPSGHPGKAFYIHSVRGPFEEKDIKKKIKKEIGGFE